MAKAGVRATVPQKVMVSVGMNGWASAQVVGRHKHLDIALLWLDRHFGDAEFTQPVATYGSVQMGEKIFVIGHPEGLNFSVSNGIVSRTPGNDVLQVSAPISPGNSGGPVYDEFGNLLGIVTSKVARSMEPEAENLNFAVSTDASAARIGLGHCDRRKRAEEPAGGFRAPGQSAQSARGSGGCAIGNLENMANITVTVYDSTENKRVPVELPDDAPANRIIAVLVDKLQLPQNGPDGAPLSYKFHHKNSGRQIQDSQTLADAAVKEGDILRLQPEITAGAR